MFPSHNFFFLFPNQLLFCFLFVLRHAHFYAVSAIIFKTNLSSFSLSSVSRLSLIYHQAFWSWYQVTLSSSFDLSTVILTDLHQDSRSARCLTINKSFMFYGLEVKRTQGKLARQARWLLEERNRYLKEVSFDRGCILPLNLWRKRSKSRSKILYSANTCR